MVTCRIPPSKSPLSSMPLLPHISPSSWHSPLSGPDTTQFCVQDTLLFYRPFEVSSNLQFPHEIGRPIATARKRNRLARVPSPMMCALTLRIAAWRWFTFSNEDCDWEYWIQSSSIESTTSRPLRADIDFDDNSRLRDNVKASSCCVSVTRLARVVGQPVKFAKWRWIAFLPVYCCNKAEKCSPNCHLLHLHQCQTILTPPREVLWIVCSKQRRSWRLFHSTSLHNHLHRYHLQIIAKTIH